MCGGDFGDYENLAIVEPLPQTATATCKGLNPQSLHGTSVLLMLADDFIHVGLGFVVIPNLFRIDDDGRAFFTAIQAARVVHADFALTR